MKVFDYLNLANPRYFKDNRMEAHSDHQRVDPQDLQ